MNVIFKMLSTVIGQFHSSTLPIDAALSDFLSIAEDVLKRAYDLTDEF